MDKIIKIFCLTIFIIFLVMFFSSSNGYYQYELNKKTNLTQESIKKFEQDVRDGKNIDINEYLIEEKKDYSNTFSNTGIKLSNKIGELFSKGVKFIFDSIGNVIDE